MHVLHRSDEFLEAQARRFPGHHAAAYGGDKDNAHNLRCSPLQGQEQGEGEYDQGEGGEESIGAEVWDYPEAGDDRSQDTESSVDCIRRTQTISYTGCAATVQRE